MQPTTMLPKLTDTTQTISFSDGDGVCSAEVFASNVVVTTNAGNHDHGSSKVKLKNLVDYNWEPKFYSGQLLAIHMSGLYLAYCIKAPNAVNPGTWNGMVRVVYNPDSESDRRSLIKGMKGEVQDLSFAHIQNQVILACIDEQGNFYVHEIEVTDSGLRCTLLAEIRDDTGVSGSGHRVVWCPYIPDDDDEAPDEDVAKLLLTTHGNIGRIWNMRVIVPLVGGGGAGAGAECGWAGALCAGGAGVRALAEHSGKLVAAAFSPDGTALATAAADGYVMFFQVYMQSESPRCLHKWQPHGGKPLSSLFFLDNHTNYNSDVQFWKFAVTGAENNTTIKVWSCKSWNCLQTIKFAPSPGGASLGLKATLDRSACYLLLSDFKSRSLYVMNMARDADDTVAYCKSISEFLLPYPVLSYCIIGAEEQQVKCESSCDDPYHRNGSSGDAAPSPDDFEIHQDEEESSGSGGSRRVCVRLYIVQPKGLQQGRLEYPPPGPQPLPLAMSDLALEDKSSDESSTVASSILQQQSQQLKNLLLRAQQPQPGSLVIQRSESPPSAPQLNLMTPDAFSSPGKREDEDVPIMASPEVTKSRNSTSGVMEEAVVLSGKLTSGGSSPSREVQQIMSHNDAEYDLEEACEEVEAAELAEVLVPAAAVTNGTDAIFPEDLFDATDNAIDDVFPPKANEVHKLTHTSGDRSWPQISLAQITSANQRAASGELCGAWHLPPDAAPPAPPAPAPADPAPPPPAPLSREDKNKLDSLEQKLDKLTELLEQQSREVRSLRAAAGVPRAMLDDALEAHSQRSVQLIENALTMGWERIARVGEAASARAAAAAGVGAARALEPLAAALQHELAAKLTATDHLLRDNIDKLANSKTVTERLSSSIAKSVSDMVRESFRSALFESVLPAMEKAHTQIFRQVNHAFQAGTKEFAAHTEAAARAAAERGGAAGTASLRAALDRHADALAAAQPPAHLLTQVLKDAAHSVLEKEMSWWREQARSVAVQMSRAHSPAPTTPSVADRQMQVAQIQSLMQGGDVNGAFQLALSASDLALVMCACRGAEPAAVFGPPCQLRQHVLLSLVQQLAADMTRDTHLKHRFLEEAVMNLDTSNPVTREHLPGVVRELQKQILAFLNSSPSHALARQFRMLLMATEALVKGTA